MFCRGDISLRRMRVGLPTMIPPTLLLFCSIIIRSIAVRKIFLLYWFQNHSLTVSSISTSWFAQCYPSRRESYDQTFQWRTSYCKNFGNNKIQRNFSKARPLYWLQSNFCIGTFARLLEGHCALAALVQGGLPRQISLGFHLLYIF